MNLEVINDAKPWYADGLSFTCTQCGNCCTGGPGYVWMSDVEIDRLSAYLKMDRKEMLRKYARKIEGRWSLKENRSPAGLYDCTFLKEIPAEKIEDGKTITYSRRICEIYPVRPLQCRTWPFWDGNLASESSWKRAKRTCPGMDRGKQYTQEQIEALRDAPDWPDRPPSSE